MAAADDPPGAVMAPTRFRWLAMPRANTNRETRNRIVGSNEAAVDTLVVFIVTLGPIMFDRRFVLKIFTAIVYIFLHTSNDSCLEVVAELSSSPSSLSSALDCYFGVYGKHYPIWLMDFFWHIEAHLCVEKSIDFRIQQFEPIVIRQQNM
jgi:hypothetical protein